MPFREMTRAQVWLMPPTLDELIPADHPARFVAEFVDTLEREEWAELGVDLNGEAMGAPAYHPRALLSVWLYGFMTNVRSCRKLEAACRDQLPCLWLTGWQHPDHNTLWRFYRKHRRSMRTLFRRTVRTAVTLELVDLAVQAVDGTKVHANAAHTRSLDAVQLNRLMERTERAIAQLEAQNEAGDDPAPVRLPERLADRETLRRRVRQARRAMALAVERFMISLDDPGWERTTPLDRLEARIELAIDGMDDLSRLVEELTRRVEALEAAREDDAGERAADAPDAEGRGLFSRWRRRGHGAGE